MSIRRGAWLALALWAIGVLLATARAGEVLRYGGDRDFKPFEFVDAEGRAQGFQIELLNELARAGGFELSIRLDDWDRIEADFRAGQLDVIAMVPTRERAQWAAFARSHATPSLAIYYATAKPSPQSLQDLHGQRVAALDRPAMHATRATLLSDVGIDFVDVATAQAALEAVRDGRAAYALLPRAYGDDLLAAVPGVAASSFSLRLQAFTLAVAPHNTALRDRLDHALAGLERSGRLEALRTKWLSSHRDAAARQALEGVNARQRMWLMSMAAASLGVFALLAYRMRRRALQGRADRAQRKQAEQSLREAEQKLAQVFFHHPDAMLLIEQSSGIVKDVNDALCRMVGAAPDELLGSTVDQLMALVAPERLAALRDVLEKDGAIDAAPLQLRRSDGELRSCLISSELLSLNDEPHVFSVVRDVTDELRANAQLHAGYDALTGLLATRDLELAAERERSAQAEGAVQSYTRGVSHDLKAPLRAIHGLAGMLKLDLARGRNDSANSNAERIGASAQRMDQLLAALGRLAQFGQTSFESSSLDMAGMANETWNLLAAAHAPRSVAFTIGELPLAQGDRALVMQVWQNLLENAWKYTARQAQPKVRIDSLSEDGRCWYQVADNGAGFDMKHARRLFLPFQRMHAKADFPGTGIGLCLALQILQRLGGDIRLHSSPGVGTVAEFTLDAAPSNASASSASEA